MADIEASDAAGKIDVAIAVNIFEGRAFGFRNVNRQRMAQAARDGRFAACGERSRFRAWDRSM
jgi:hypothetical protein